MLTVLLVITGLTLAVSGGYLLFSGESRYEQLADYNRHRADPTPAWMLEEFKAHRRRRNMGICMFGIGVTVAVLSPMFYLMFIL